MEMRTVKATLLTLLLVPGLAAAQQPGPELRAALDALRADNAWTLEQQRTICEIPAPPFKETRRGEEYRRRLTSLGLKDVRVDRVGNVIALRPGTGAGQDRTAVVISAHLDTVFPEGTDVTVKREGSVMRGPGIADDCRGLAVLLAVARAFERAGVRTERDVYFVGTVGEEGPGNLRGVRALFEGELKGRIGHFISVDGGGSTITSRAVGSVRYKVHYRGPGGHSYGQFGMPNPIHAMGRAIAKVADVQVPRAPKTTFNVGVVEGGTSVNTISASAAMEVDMRSESAEALRALDAEVSRALRAALDEENARWPGQAPRLTMQVDTIGIRPTGAQSDTAAIVRIALESAKAVGLEARTTATSTDANIPISLGIPGIAMDGGGRDQGSHSPSELYDDGDRGWTGPQWAAMLVWRLAGGK